MTVLRYEAVAPTGRRVRGREEAASPESLRDSLKGRGLLLLECQADRRPIRKAEGVVRPARTGSDLTSSIVALGAMLEAGSPLDQALDVARRSARHEETRAAWAEVRGRVRAGASLGDAMAELGPPFSRFVVGIVRAGESGGRLSPALRELASWMERRDALRSDLVGGLAYPAVVGIVGFVSVGLLFAFVLPVFGDLLADAQMPLPATTALLLRTGSALAAWWPGLLVGGALLALAIHRYARTPAGRRRLHGLWLRLPVLGPLREAYAAVQVGRCLASLLGQGAPVLRALGVCEAVVTDEVVRHRLADVFESVRSGGKLAPALADAHCFPPAFLHLVEVGEESGRLPVCLGHASALAERDLQARLQALVRLAEPAMILVLGAVVGFVALALLQAVYGIQAGGF